MYTYSWRYRGSKWLRCGLVSPRVRLRVLEFAVLLVYQSMMVFKSEATRLLWNTAVAWAKKNGKKKDVQKHTTAGIR